MDFSYFQFLGQGNTKISSSRVCYNSSRVKILNYMHMKIRLAGKVEEFHKSMQNLHEAFF